MSVRYLLDSRLLRHLCVSGGPAVVSAFRASLERHGFAPAGALPFFELTPFGLLGTLGVVPPPYEVFRLPPKVLRVSPDHATLTTVLVQQARDFYQKAPDLEIDRLRARAGELLKTAGPEARDLLEPCLEGTLGQPGIRDRIVNHLALDYLYRFRFPEPLRENLFHFLAVSLLAVGEGVSGLSKSRIIKVFWDRWYERLLKRNPLDRPSVQALDREMNPRTFEDFRAWEVIHHAVLGYEDSQKQGHPVTAFVPDSKETAEARCSAYKSALRLFLDQSDPAEVANDFQAPMERWKPGWVVPCRQDGSFDPGISTADLPVY